MRRLLWAPVVLVVLACGGTDLSGPNVKVFPNAKNYSVTFQNNGPAATDMWIESEGGGAGARTNVASGQSRLVNQQRIWLTENQIQTFRFHAQVGAGPTANATLTINGIESHADNFGGFTATWNGTTLSVATRP